jgi:RNA polymerase sigma-70 factor (ECF subfamily)
LAAILKHKIVDWRRREAREPGCGRSSRPSDREPEPDDAIDMLFDSAGRWVTPPSEWPLPDQSLESMEFRAMLDRCLAMLPPAMARAFYLREIEGLNTREICAELGVSESNCWVMLHRARVRLRQYLEEHWILREGKREASSRTARQAEAGAVRD